MPKTLKLLSLFLISFSIVVGVILLTIAALLKYVSYKTYHPASYFLANVANAVSNPYSQEQFNVLVLGLDYRDDSLEKTQTTDTIMLTSYNLNNNKVNLVSIPRDLWNPQIKAKVNQIYPLSLNSQSPITFIKQNFSEFTGQRIDRVLVLTTNNLSELIDIVGGVNIDLEQGFIDKEFPNPEYVKNPSKDIPKYITVEFKAGPVLIDASNVNQFVRSRKGGQTVQEGGTDLGRIKRQQQLIDALLEKLRNPNTIKQQPEIAFKLYNFFHQKLQTDITDQDLFSLIFSKKIDISSVSLNKHEIVIGNTAKDGLIYHPNKLIEKQWVFLLSDPSGEQFKSFLNKTFAE